MKWIFFIFCLNIAFAQDGYEVKDNAGVTKFQRITENEKALNSIMARLSQLESEVKSLKADLEKLSPKKSSKKEKNEDEEDNQ